VTAHLHAALRGYPGEQPFLLPLGSFVSDGLAQLEGRPDLLNAADLDRPRREWAVWEPLACSRTAFEVAFPQADVQPIHGDAPFYNIIVTPEGELCSDFEHVTLGPFDRWRTTPLAEPPGRRPVFDNPSRSVIAC
jgi:Ser/Thr protein kinase RdoA (MazF antagonist)